MLDESAISITQSGLTTEKARDSISSIMKNRVDNRIGPRGGTHRQHHMSTLRTRALKRSGGNRSLPVDKLITYTTSFYNTITNRIKVERKEEKRSVKFLFRIRSRSISPDYSWKRTGFSVNEIDYEAGNVYVGGNIEAKTARALTIPIKRADVSRLVSEYGSKKKAGIRERGGVPFILRNKARVPIRRAGGGRRLLYPLRPVEREKFLEFMIKR